jgi:hypothetical protein
VERVFATDLSNVNKLLIIPYNCVGKNVFVDDNIAQTAMKPFVFYLLPPIFLNNKGSLKVPSSRFSLSCTACSLLIRLHATLYWRRSCCINAGSRSFPSYHTPPLASLYSCFHAVGFSLSNDCVVWTVKWQTAYVYVTVARLNLDAVP